MANKVDPRSGELTTANYGWIKPTVGSSVDAWGGYINTDLDGIDSTVKGVSNVANAAAPGDNRIINGDFAINQRVYVSGTALATTVYGHDRWKAGSSGCTYTFTAVLPDTTITITAGTLTQVIEAGAIASGVYTLSWTGTAQARVYQGAPTGSYAASPVITASLTAGTNTIVEFNIGTVVRVKFESGNVASPYNRPSLAKSLADCQRYYHQDFTPIIIAFNSWGAGAAIQAALVHPTTMRATPTIGLGASSANTNITSLVASNISPARFALNSAATAAGGASITVAGYTANAEL